MLGPHDRIIRRMTAGVGLLLGLMLVGMGGSCARQALAPNRNVRGNPANEDLVQRCTVPGTETIIRLYRGSGGATTASWYSVTRQRPDGRELQFWFSYGAPALTGIACRANQVDLLGPRGTPLVETFAVEHIERELVPRPLVYIRGDPQRVSRDSVRPQVLVDTLPTLFVAISAVLAGAALAITGTRALARARRG